MKKSQKHITSEEVLAAAESPIFRLLSALSTDNPDEISNPEDIRNVLKWTRSYKSDDPQFADKLAVETDYKHLGFFDKNGVLIPEIVTVGRKFIKAHSAENPQYSRLWRHIQAHLGKVHPEDISSDFADYSAHIAERIDQGAGPVEIATAVLKADQSGMAVPTVALCQADRLRLITEAYPNFGSGDIETALNQRDFDWFPPDNVANAMRQLLKDQNYGQSEADVNAWIDDQGKPSFTRQIKGLFGNRNKAKNLRDLGLLDANWQWSETGFQRHRAILREAVETGREPNFEWLRWKTHQRHNAHGTTPFHWSLMNDFLFDPVVHRAKRLASIALSGGLLGDKVTVGETITPEQYQTLRKIGAWIHDPFVYAKQDALWWIGFLAQQQAVNWKNWEQICSFVYDKIDQAPDPALLKDWKDGIVTFEGRGRHQSNPATPFRGAKVGRNDPCPCGSGKKYKKCCGR
jgi:hypothetical protein